MTNWVAFSGGVDSHVLLHFLHTLPYLKPLRAIHINHQLQPNALECEKHCRKICRELKIPLKIIRVTIYDNNKKNNNLESRAREARYTAFKKIIKKNDTLFLAHHHDDQAETVLLQLFRGSGLRGVSSMSMMTPFEQGFIYRPFLKNITREIILQYAQIHKLNWFDDPSNQATYFDRNFLRHEIFPKLQKRWPGITKTLTRFANHCGEQEKISENIASHDLNNARQKNMLRLWIRQKNIPVPSEKVLDQIITMQSAKPDSHPLVEWPGGECRRIKNPRPDSPNIIISDNKNISVKFRQGGEKIKPKNSKHTKTIKKLFQELNIPVWERDNIPLLYYNNTLIAVLTGDKYHVHD